ncbi:MAG: hypothetical protein OEN55_13785 [Alphaproteobacteria bacterium]|nr:hypothetical protein [Alphaproteobacteria bacterium]
MNRLAVAVAGVALLGVGALAAEVQDTGMSFFITSAGPGDGANLGGLKGADAHCQALAGSVGASGRTWRAYLSSSAENARDRIGDGPWYNAKGVLIARDLAALHGDANAINKQTGLTESGAAVNGRGDQPNRHDILTGSNPDGTLAAGKTCNDWSQSGDGSAIVGHHDRIGLRDDAPSKSWNSSHGSRGCGQEALRGTGGDGLLYCFVAD